MLKIGLLVGRERSFPDALIEEINGRKDGVVAEYARTAEVNSADSVSYHVLLDRISHEVVFYQGYLKKALLSGAAVINNPFWRIADDKFFGTSLVQKLGVAVPKTVLLPQHSYPDSIAPESLRNLGLVDWKAMVEYIGMPAILKPHWGGGWRDVHKVHSLEELIGVYNQTGQLCMILQEFIHWTQYVRCICVGKTNILVTNWDPTKPHLERYRGVDQNLDESLMKRIRSDATKINEALGYDMNTVEFGIRDGIPYAIDFMNSAPDFDITSLTEKYFGWVVNAMADLLIARAKEAVQKKTSYRWDLLMGL